MITFLPYPDLRASAQCLDRSRLGKQRLEVAQLVRAVVAEDPTSEYGDDPPQVITPPVAFRRHPAAMMWIDHVAALIEYGLQVCLEWITRGYDDTIGSRLIRRREELVAAGLIESGLAPLPGWFGDDRVHSSHRANLLYKYPTHYRRLGWTDPSPAPYVWPHDWIGDPPGVRSTRVECALAVPTRAEILRRLAVAA